MQGWQGLVVWRNRVNFGRDKFTGYLFAPFIDALTDDRHHIEIRGCRYTAPPLTSSGSVVCQGPTREVYKKIKRAKVLDAFHDSIGAFRRKADYNHEKTIINNCNGNCLIRMYLYICKKGTSQ